MCNGKDLQAVGPELAVAVKPLEPIFEKYLEPAGRVSGAYPAYLVTQHIKEMIAEIRSALVATPPAEPVVEALRTEADNAYCRFLDKMSAPLCLGVEHKLETGKFGAAELNAHVDARELYGFHRGINHALAALAAKPAVKDDETVVEALRGATASLVAAVSLLKRGSKKAAPSDKMFDQMILDYEKSIKEARAALAAKDGRS